MALVIYFRKIYALILKLLSRHEISMEKEDNDTIVWGHIMTVLKYDLKFYINK